MEKQILAQLQDNLEIAASDMIPICQDTGMAVVFLEVGQDVHFEGGSFEDAVNEGCAGAIRKVFEKVSRRRPYFAGKTQKIILLRLFIRGSWKVIE